MNVGIITAIVGIVIAVVLAMFEGLHMALGRWFDKDWQKMSRDERWKLQNEARKKNV